VIEIKLEQDARHGDLILHIKWKAKSRRLLPWDEPEQAEKAAPMQRLIKQPEANRTRAQTASQQTGRSTPASRRPSRDVFEKSTNGGGGGGGEVHGGPAVGLLAREWVLSGEVKSTGPRDRILKGRRAESNRQCSDEAGQERAGDRWRFRHSRRLRKSTSAVW